MASLFQALDSPGVGKLLSGKGEDYVSLFVSQRHSVGERTLPVNPARVNSQRLVGPEARKVKAFVEEGLHHSLDLDFRALPGQAGYATDYTWHAILFDLKLLEFRYAFSSPGNLLVYQRLRTRRYAPATGSGIQSLLL